VRDLLAGVRQVAAALRETRSFVTAGPVSQCGPIVHHSSRLDLIVKLAVDLIGLGGTIADGESGERNVVIRELAIEELAERGSVAASRDN